MSQPRNFEFIRKALDLKSDRILFWNFGKPQIKSVAIISGDAPNEVRQAIDQGMDLYITGESSHALYHECKESKMNVLFAGHYQTEIYGPQLMGELIAKKWHLDITFIDCPTHL